MEKINTEILVSSLLIIGFDKVDPALYTYTLGKLTIDNYKLKLFELEEAETSKTFNEFIYYDGITFKLKNGYSLNTNISPKQEYTWPLINSLHKSNKLIDYLNSIDFSEIVLKKAEIYGIQSISQIDESKFNYKEIEILKHLGFPQNNKALNLTVNHSQIV